ncbi:OpgC domain-containing protein [Bosea sp. 685]|uniref:OpgC family protein n=1 Tax=Bosea sp. 685 TaxID=3080057 RepID=UPI0028929C05|nr:OpgC domain-containing protein [Bosea sp. 685]WNJ92737.1 OpgC domain-containing protein [Bosea sp. 685]
MSQALIFGRFLAFGRHAATAGLQPGRDARIDIIRGLALLVIFINHMPGNVLAGYTPHNFGFSDAADAFVLLAGVSAALAYGPLIDRHGLTFGTRRIARRLRTLYIAHIAVFLIVCGVVAAAVTRTQNPLYIETINIQPFFSDTPTALLHALTLQYQPNYLDILPLYIALLALFPLIHLGVRLSPALTLILSAGLWQGAVFLELNLPNTGSAGWFFNPFAWQFLFTMGVVIGRSRQLGLVAPHLRPLDVAAAGYLVFAVIVKTASGNPFGIAAMNDWIDTVQLGMDKTNLGWERVLHVAALAWLVIRFVPVGSAMLSSSAARLLAGLGRHSLEVFCAGIVLAIIGQVILAETAFALGVQLLVCAIGVTMLIGLGVFLSWHHSASSRNAPAKPSLTLGASGPQR